MKKRKIIILTSLCLLILLTLTYMADRQIIKKSSAFITDDVNKLKVTNTALLLGTNPQLKDGSRNDFFYFRIDAAVELFKAGKIKFVIVSGDNSKETYNEPVEMKKALVNRGIPEKVIFLDFAGLRTFDSVIRAREIFGQNSFIVVSQKFHNERAVFIARKYGIEAYGFNAKEVEAFKGLKTKLREFLAGDKVFIDLLFGMEPKFSGEKVTIP
jgi:SanA protein